MGTSSGMKQYKPRSHYTLIKNDLIKIAGVAYLNKEYHFFDLHSPFGKDENFYVVGHGVSKDTVISKNLNDAVYPTLKEDKDGVEDCCSIVIDDKIYLFYIANVYNKRDKNNINIHDLEAIEEVSVLCLFSNDGYNFDNTHDKKILLRTKDIEEIGFAKETVEAIGSFIHPVNNQVYIVLVGLKNNVRSIASFLFDKEKSELKFLNVSPFTENKYRVTSISICEIIESVNDDLMITCSVCKENRSGAYSISENLDLYSRSYCLLGNFDVKTGLFTYKEETKSRFDTSEDITSIRVGLDNRKRLMAYGCIPFDYEIKNSSGMFSLPRRITYHNEGKFTFSVHPLIDILTANQMFDYRLKKTHFPIKATFSLSLNEYVIFGNIKIYLTNDGVVVDRKNCLNRKGYYVRREEYLIKVDDVKNVNVMCFFDEDIVEVIVNNNTFLTMVIHDLGNVVTCSEKTKPNLKLYSMNHVKKVNNE